MHPFQKELYSSLTNTLVSTKALVVLGIVILFSISGLKWLKLSADYRVYFDSDSSLYQLDQSISDRYELTDSLLLVLSSNISFLDERVWNSVSKLAEELQQLPLVTQVKSYQIIAESNNSQPYNAEFDDEWQESKSLAERQELYFTHPRARQILSQNALVTLVKIEVNLGENTSAREILSFNQLVEAKVNQFRTKNSFVKDIQLGGVQSLNRAYIEVVRHDLKLFIPALFIIFAAGLYFFYRDTRVVAIVLACGFLSVFSAFGMAGWFNLKLAAINAFVPVIIVSISIATAAHLFTIFFQKLRIKNDVSLAINNSIKENFLAITLSNLTTAAGFILLLTSPSPPIRVVGILVATGTLFSYLCSQLLLPFLVCKYIKNVSPERLDVICKTSSLNKFKRLILENSRTVYFMLPVFLVISIAGFLKLEVNDNVYEYFPEDHQLSLTNQNIKTKFGGISRIVLSVDSGKEYGVLDKDYLTFIDKLTQKLKSHENVIYVNNISQLIKEREMNLNYLAKLAATESPSNIGIASEVSQNYRESKIELILKTSDAKNTLSLASQIKNWVENNASPYTTSDAVGPDVMFSELGKRNSESLFYSLILALVMIALLIGWLFRSVRITILALICNIVPLTTVYALWFLFGGYLSLGSSVMMGMIMGILVDDTIHLLVKYKRSQSQSLSDPIDSIFRSVAPAILITSLTLVAGLLIGLFSSFRPIVELSGLSAATIFVALVIDLTLLPVALKNVGTNSQNIGKGA